VPDHNIVEPDGHVHKESDRWPALPAKHRSGSEDPHLVKKIKMNVWFYIFIAYMCVNYN